MHAALILKYFIRYFLILDISQFGFKNSVPDIKSQYLACVTCRDIM